MASVIELDLHHQPDVPNRAAMGRPFPLAFDDKEQAAPAWVPAGAPLATPEDVASGLSERRNWTAMGLVLLAHLGLVALLLTMTHGQKLARKAEALMMVDISEPVSQPAPPPPPSQIVPLSELAPPVVEITAPEPMVKVPVQPAMSVAVARIVPPPVAAVTASAPAAPTPAPPAPIVPPDYSASQLDNPGPSYPFLSRKAREEGVVLLRVLVDSSGRAESLQVEQSSGFKRLDEAALKTVSKWRFVPATQAGKPVGAWVLVPITFALG